METLFITHALSKNIVMEKKTTSCENVKTMEHSFAEFLVQSSYVGLECTMTIFMFYALEQIQEY